MRVVGTGRLVSIAAVEPGELFILDMLSGGKRAALKARSVVNAATSFVVFLDPAPNSPNDEPLGPFDLMDMGNVPWEASLVLPDATVGPNVRLPFRATDAAGSRR